MDFFEHQESARRSTKRLVVLFVTAVILIVIAVNVVAAFVFQNFVAPGAAPPVGLFVMSSLIVLALIGGGTAYEMHSLRAGGQVVARMVGAREIDPTTRDLADRRLANIVEEMAIASGVPVPRVFVMDDEASINAFAAGHSINDAVVAVTHGTLTRLSRDELQGVVAHEFSHILNGDMRLNMRLVGVLAGLMIVALAGRFLLEAGGRGRSSSGRGGGGALAAILMAGVALWLLGYIGVVFGRLIKAAVSRQREYLADASAVQFTRNPDGIGGALRKIGGLSRETGLGSKIDHPQAETLSHMFLGAPRRNFMRGFLATHPPIEDRLRRIYGRSVEVLPAPEDPALVMDEPAAASAFAPAASQPPTHRAAVEHLPPLASLLAAGALAPARVTDTVGTVDAALLVPSESAAEQPSTELLDAAHDATQAQWLVLALLIDSDGELKAQQRQMIVDAYGVQPASAVDDFHRRAQRLSPQLPHALLDIAAPSLRRLGALERARLLKTAKLLIAADGRVTVPEFLLYSIVRRRLEADASASAGVSFGKLAALAREAALVLSLIAVLRLPQRPDHAFNAGALLLSGIDIARVPSADLRLDEVSAALDRLNQLAPLAKPQLIKAAAAVAFVDGSTDWRAAAALRLLCAALDAPLPPQLADAVSSANA